MTKVANFCIFYLATRHLSSQIILLTLRRYLLQLTGFSMYMIIIWSEKRLFFPSIFYELFYLFTIIAQTSKTKVKKYDESRQF